MKKQSCHMSIFQMFMSQSISNFHTLLSLTVFFRFMNSIPEILKIHFCYFITLELYSIVYRNGWFKKPIVVSFCSVLLLLQSTRSWLSQRIKQIASFSSLSRNFRYLENILQYSASYLCSNIYMQNVNNEERGQAIRGALSSTTQQQL